MNKKKLPRDVCQICGSKMYVNERLGTLVCKECAFCSSAMVFDETNEYRNFAIEHGVKDKSRAAYSGDSMISDLGTDIQRDGKKSTRELSDMHKRKQQDPKLQRLKMHLNEIQSIARQLELSSQTATAAKEICKEACNDNVKFSKSKAIYLVCIYFACAKTNNSLDQTYILNKAGAGDVTDKDFMQATRQLKKYEVVPLLSEIARGYASRLKWQPFICNAVYDVAEVVEDCHFAQGVHNVRVCAGVLQFINLKLTPKYSRDISQIELVTGSKADNINDYVNKIRGVEESLLEKKDYRYLIKKMEKESKANM